MGFDTPNNQVLFQRMLWRNRLPVQVYNERRISNAKKRSFSFWEFYEGVIILPSYIVITTSHYKDPDGLNGKMDCHWCVLNAETTSDGMPLWPCDPHTLFILAPTVAKCKPAPGNVGKRAALQKRAKRLSSPSETNPRLAGWWFQPIWKICSSKWVHLPHFSGWKSRLFELPPPRKSCQQNHHSRLLFTWDPHIVLVDHNPHS